MVSPHSHFDDDVRIDTDGELFDRVNAALAPLRPALQDDGGDVVLVEIEDESIAIVRFTGACAGCPVSEMSVRYGLESHLRGLVPEIMAVDVVAPVKGPQATFREVLDRASFTPLQ